jgi:hypothetical protein
MGGLAEQLYGLYQAEIYTVLSNNDPEYQRSLANAGLGWNVRSIPAEKRSSFEQEMKMRAWMGARRVEEARSLAPGTMRAKVLTGPTKLYRVSQSGSKGPIGIWWFGEQVAQRCRKEAGGVASQQLEWLRNVLAVCFNWSTFDRVERFSLHSGERIPAVLGKGLPMPHYKVSPYTDRKTGEQVVDLPVDYWQNKGKMLIGGELQIVLPWIPVHRVSNSGPL